MRNSYDRMKLRRSAGVGVNNRKGKMRVGLQRSFRQQGFEHGIRIGPGRVVLQPHGWTV